MLEVHHTSRCACPFFLPGKQDPRVVRVMTIDGVGPRTAEALVAAIDDPHRFDNARQVSDYFGLVPKQYQSGETDRNGRISKRGPSLRTPDLGLFC